ncbi:MAG: ATP-binding protein [Bacteroidota bacterium]
MARPNWKVISSLGPEMLPHLSGMTDIAVAEVGADGIITNANAEAYTRYGWQNGMRLPSSILAKLQGIYPGEPLQLPMRGDTDRIMLALRVRAEAGWVLLSYPQDDDLLGIRPSRFKSLVEKIPVLILRMQADGTVLYANSEAERMTGYTLAELRGTPFWVPVVHPEDRWKVVGAVRRAVEGRKAIVAVRFIAASSAVRFAEMHLFPPTDERPDEVEAVVFDVTEQSEVEDALFQSEVLYRTFLEQSPMGMLHLDREGLVTFENHQFRQIVGEDLEDAWLGRRIYDIGGLEPGLLELLRTMLSQGIPVQGAHIAFTASPQKATQYLIIRGTPIHQPDGSIVGGVLSIEDVTTQRHREAELKLRGRYSEAEAALREAAIDTSREADFLREAVRIMGEAAVGERVHILTDSEGDDYKTIAEWDAYGGLPNPLVVPRPLMTAFNRRPNKDDILYIRHPDKAKTRQALIEHTGAAEALWVPIRQAARRAYVLIDRVEPQPGHQPFWSALDVELAQRLVRLFETLWTWLQVESRYHLAVSTIDDALFNFTFGANGKRIYRFLTPQVEALTGHPAQAVFFDADDPLDWVQEVVVDEDRAAVEAHDAALRAGQESRVSYRVRRPNAALDAAPRWLLEQATPLIGSDGQVTASGILTDVTEQKAAEAVLMQAKSDAETANRLKSAFIATMSHEIRTPLGAVNGYADLLRRELSEFTDATSATVPNEVMEFAEAIQENAQKLLGLVNDLFDLTNIEFGSMSLRRIRVPLHPIIEQSIERFAPLLSRKGLALITDFAEDELVVDGDPHRVTQIIDNLLSNAVKFTETGHITIRTARVGDEVEVAIRDTGVGMSEGYLDQLFTPFMQEDNALSRHYEGTGLGLALVKRILDLMEGRIDVQSAKDDGSTFTVYLPAALEE